MRIQLDADYKAGSLMEIPDPHDPSKNIKIQLPQDYEANTWVEVSRIKYRLLYSQVPIDTENTGVSRHSTLPTHGIIYPLVGNTATVSAPEIDSYDVENSVETVVYTQAQPVYIAQTAPVVVQSQPVLVHSVGQPVYVYDHKPNVVVIEEEKKGLDDRDCCAILLGVCLCSWFFAALTR